jgi:hypothetical protein
LNRLVPFADEEPAGLDQEGRVVYNPNMRGNSSTLLRRLLDPVSRCFSDEGARELVNLRADEETQARVSELAGKCNEGTLSPEERAEYEAYVMAADVVAILQAKARARLASAS